jgi:hypothetical protein
MARRVREIQEELRTVKGLNVKDVIMTSDEDDPAWWADVKKEGFKYPDHTKTEEEYGRWYICLYILLPSLTSFSICTQVSSSH